MITSLTLPDHLYGEVISHARESLPREAVGLIGGTPGGLAFTVIPLSNLASGRHAFFADPYDQFVALRRLESDGWTLLAIYHSHPAGGIDPSHLDLQYATRWECAHMITAIGHGCPPDGQCRAFVMTVEGNLTDVSVIIEVDERAATGGKQKQTIVAGDRASVKLD